LSEEQPTADLHTFDPTSPEPALPTAPPPPLVAPASVLGIQDPELNLVDVLLVLLAAGAAFVFCALIAGVVLVVVFGPHPEIAKDSAKAALLGIPIQVAMYALTVGFMAFYVREKYHVGLLGAVRWNMPVRKLAWFALAGGSALAFASAMAEGLLHRWIPKSLPIDQFFSNPKSAYVMAVFGVLVAPLVEELFFRGFLYPALARRLGEMWGIGLTAALFAALHGSQLALAWAPLLVLFLVGTVLTLIRARTNSLATCVLVHAGYNLTLFIMLFFATGHFHHMEKV
jgi:uncharacterized protein